uniref:Uncharacterized protein LOC113799581 isoform X1 n=1 Tax=Dermatophagoides pteronyssinus TaxID=6956 RepID=A0A6P6YKI3_DERPT|nr:uncharacterized protein LOC113799581 isoform X1 [Dermatophagoides pteronyssinus]
MIDFLYYVVVLELFIGKSKSSNLERLSNPPPYKSYYEFPKNCPDLKFSGSTMSQEELRKEYYKCQSKHIDRWKITTSNYYTETREFCCFVKTVLTCEKPILTLCDKTYSQLNEDDTERLFGKSCNQFTCDETDTNLMSKILKWVLFIGGGILSALMLYCAGRYGYEKGKEWWELRNMDPNVREKLETTSPFVTKQTEFELYQLKAAANHSKLETENSKWKFYRKYKLHFEKILRNRKLKQQAKKNIELEMNTNPEVFWEPLINKSTTLNKITTSSKIVTPPEAEKPSELLESIKTAAFTFYNFFGVEAAADSQADVAALDGKLDTENSKWKFYRKFKLRFEKIFLNRKLKQQAQNNIEHEMNTNPEPLINENTTSNIVTPPEKPSQLLESLKTKVSTFYNFFGAEATADSRALGNNLETQNSINSSMFLEPLINESTTLSKMTTSLNIVTPPEAEKPSQLLESIKTTVSTFYNFFGAEATADADGNALT